MKLLVTGFPWGCLEHIRLDSGRVEHPETIPSIDVVQNESWQLKNEGKQSKRKSNHDDPLY